MKKEAHMVDSLWRPKPGELVQIWDYQNGPDHGAKINGHGLVGYVVKKAATGENFSADIWKVICFGDDEGIVHNVWHGWLRPINKSSDIKKVE